MTDTNLPPLYVCNKSRATHVKRRGWSGVISFADIEQHGVLRFTREPHPEHLLIRCEDLDEPLAEIVTPTLGQVEQILEMGRRHEVGALLIHCNAGIGRSTAAALVILAERFGRGHDIEALQVMLTLQPRAVPNLAIVAHGDRLLLRGGALLRTVQEWDNRHERNLRRRQANRAAYCTIGGAGR